MEAGFFSLIESNDFYDLGKICIAFKRIGKCKEKNKEKILKEGCRGKITKIKLLKIMKKINKRKKNDFIKIKKDELRLIKSI